MLWNKNRKEDIVELSEEELMEDMERETIMMTLHEQLGQEGLHKLWKHVDSLMPTWKYLDKAKYTTNFCHEEQFFMSLNDGKTSVTVNSKIKNCNSVRSMNQQEPMHYLLFITVHAKGVTTYSVRADKEADIREFIEMVYKESKQV